jgi:putative restriction endonuclease
MPRYFLHFWTTEAWSRARATRAGERLSRVSGGLLRRSGISPGDFLYAAWVHEGVLWLAGRMEVAQILPPHADQEDLWEPTIECVCPPEQGTVLRFDHKVPRRIVQAIRLEGPSGLQPLPSAPGGKLDGQSLRSVRGVSPESAALLDALLEDSPAGPERSEVRRFGEPPRVPVGRVFMTRRELAAAGVHRPLQAGVSGSQRDGADSLVIAGGYEDDVDHGEEVLFTGAGGHNPNTGRQVANQELARWNLALVKNLTDGLPVRVVRGAELGSPYAPAAGYRYDGLYRVERYWRTKGRAGFWIWRFKLSRDDPSPAPWERQPALPFSMRPAPRRASLSTQRVVRSSPALQKVKELHGYSCQVCGMRLETPGGPYAEAAHLQPLGAPHQGPDVPENGLCLCPNHHVLFELGAFSIADDLRLVGLPGALLTVPGHTLRRECIAYHREHIGGGALPRDEAPSDLGEPPF